MNGLLRLLASMWLTVIFACAFTHVAAESHDNQLSESQDLATARALVNSGYYPHALVMLREMRIDRPDGMEILFLRGLSAMELSNTVEDEAIKNALLDEAIRSLNTIVVNNPNLVRPRLELARAHYLRENDKLAREHFEAVLAFGPPRPVVININRFLESIERRKRWTANFGIGIAPDSNIGAVSDKQIVNILGLPFELDAPEQVQSGIGLSVSTGVEYQAPLSDTGEFKLRAGSNLSVTDYRGSRFDSAQISAHVGPQWQFLPSTSASLLGLVSRRMRGGEAYYHDGGARLELSHFRSPIHHISSSFEIRDRKFDAESNASADGQIYRLTLGTNYRLSPTQTLGASYTHVYTDAVSEKNSSTSGFVDLSLNNEFEGGYNLTFGVSLGRTGFDGDWFPFLIDGSTRSDRFRGLRVAVNNANIQLAGFSPTLTLSYETRGSNISFYDYAKKRASLSLNRVF